MLRATCCVARARLRACGHIPLPLLRAWSGARTATTATTHGVQQVARAGRTTRARVVLTLLASGVSLPAIKIYLALRPLLHESAQPDGDTRRPLMPSGDALSSTLTWRLWLLGEASDRLIRDVYAAACIIAAYARVSRSGAADWSATHLEGGRIMLALCRANKGVYTKLGQHIGQLDYLLPAEYVETLRVLTHAAPTDAWEQVRAVWRAEMGGEIEEAFAYIDPTPIASASLAQVHVGMLKGSGRRVAVKVQHAGLRETSRADIATIVLLAHLVKAIFPRFDYLWLADEVERNLPLELDFTVEAANAERTRAAFRSRPEDVVVPSILPAFSSPRVLTMSFEEGVYANNLPAIKAMGLDPRDVASLVSQAFAAQIFLLGWVHADPHAANLLIRVKPGSGGGRSRPTPQLVLLDHGLYRELQPDLRYNYAKLWRSLVYADERGIAKYAGRLGAGGAYQLFAAMLTTRSWDKILAARDGDLESLRTRTGQEDRDETAANVREYADGIQAILATIPRDLLLVLKTNDCLRCVDHALGAPLNNFPIIARACQRALNDKRAASRPGLLTSVQSGWETAALELRLRSLGWAFALYRTVSPVLWWAGRGAAVGPRAAAGAADGGAGGHDAATQRTSGHVVMQ